MERGRRPTRPILPTPLGTSPLECSRLRPGLQWARPSMVTATGAAVTSTSTPPGRTTSRGTSTTGTLPTPVSSSAPRVAPGKTEASGSTTPSIARACNTVTTPPSSASTRAARATLSPGRRSVAAPDPTPAVGSRAGLVKRVLGGTARAGSVSRVGAARAESDSKAGVGKAGSGSRARAARAESVSREAAASATVEHRHHPALAVSARVAPVKAASRVAPSREWEAAVTLRASATAATRAVTASIDRLVEEELGAAAVVAAAAVAAAEEVVDDSANLVARVRDHVRARSGGGRAGTRPGARAREAGSTRSRKAGDRAETGGGPAKDLRVSRRGDAGSRPLPARGINQGAVGDPRQREPRARFLRRCGGRQAEPREVPERVRRSEQARRER